MDLSLKIAITGFLFFAPLQMIISTVDSKNMNIWLVGLIISAWSASTIAMFAGALIFIWWN